VGPIRPRSENCLLASPTSRRRSSSPCRRAVRARTSPVVVEYWHDCYRRTGRPSFPCHSFFLQVRTTSGAQAPRARASRDARCRSRNPTSGPCVDGLESLHAAATAPQARSSPGSKRELPPTSAPCPSRPARSFGPPPNRRLSAPPRGRRLGGPKPAKLGMTWRSDEPSASVRTRASLTFSSPRRSPFAGEAFSSRACRTVRARRIQRPEAKGALRKPLLGPRRGPGGPRLAPPASSGPQSRPSSCSS